MPMDNFGIIYCILRYLEKAMDFDFADMEAVSAETLKISRQRWSSLLEMLVSQGYVEGVSIHRASDGALMISFVSPRITLRGLEYLQENPMMLKASNFEKGIAETV